MRQDVHRIREHVAAASAGILTERLRFASHGKPAEHERPRRARPSSRKSSSMRTFHRRAVAQGGRGVDGDGTKGGAGLTKKRASNQSFTLPPRRRWSAEGGLGGPGVRGRRDDRRKSPAP